MTTNSVPLTEEEKSTYEWQMWSEGFGEEGQEKLKGSSVLISRVGGVGSAVAYYLAAAGVGKLVLAHRGPVRFSDLNRQILMTHDHLGKERVESAERRLKELNPRIEILTTQDNVTEENAARLVDEADLVVDCAPLFQERFLMNREAVKQKKPLVDCAMYDMEAQITTMIPGKTPCLACIVPETPPGWIRQFPVFGAVAGVIGTMAAVEAIKVLSGVGEPLLGRLLTCDLKSMSFRTLRISRNPKCAVCS